MNSDLTPQEFQNKLMNDPNYLINFIVENNLEETTFRAISLGYGGIDEDITTKEDVLFVLNDLLSKGDKQNFRYILAVPLRPEKLSAIYYNALELATNQVYQRLVETGVYPRTLNPLF